MDSYHTELQKREFNVGPELEVAPLWRVDQRYGARIALRFRSKETRDDACRQLAQSPARKRTDPDARV